ncbi:MAG TPA: hypothetical protein DG753_07190 [Clostridium sp.]|nr:hypothetical protein [Clostridium sp.]
MYILKPQKGFVIPVEYISNEKLYGESTNNLRYETAEKIIDFINDNNNDIFAESQEIETDIEDEVIRDRLFNREDEKYNKEHNNNVITAVLDENEKITESRSGILIFDDVSDNNNIEIDKINAIKLDTARGNLRKAIEVEIEKVGKLVLDDSEISINSNPSVKTVEADVQIDERNNDELEGNIVTDGAREEGEDELIGEVTLSNEAEAEDGEDFSDNN